MIPRPTLHDDDPMPDNDRDYSIAMPRTLSDYLTGDAATLTREQRLNCYRSEYGRDPEPDNPEAMPLPETLPAPASPIFAYGDLAILSRAVLVLLRQVREMLEQLFTEFGIAGPRARARMAEIDAILAEIAALGERRIEMAAETDEATR